MKTLSRLSLVVTASAVNRNLQLASHPAMARQFQQNYTLLGYVTEIYPEDGCFKIRVRSGDDFYCYPNSEVWYRPLPNLFGSYDRYGSIENDDGSIAAKIRKYIAVGARVLVEGIYHRNGMSGRVDIRTVYLLYSQDGKKISDSKGPYMFEEPLWWVNMITAQGNTWFNNFFSDGVIDFTKYRTDLNELYQPKGPNQECAVMSRLLYGFAVTYQLTGKQKYLDALRAGVEYQRNTFRIVMPDGKSVLWAAYYDGTNIHLPSKDGDDAGTIPLYEQIYSLAGITMYYRITGDVDALKDIMDTIDAFDVYFLDKGKDGSYFSHLDPDTLSPNSEALGINQSKKNWNSVGDHVPAYLINLICALSGRDEYEEESIRLHKMLLDITDDICTHFPANDGSPLVYERFLRDWTPDLTYSWQQDRGIIGHNLKIAWNLTRVAFYLDTKGNDKLYPKDTDTKRRRVSDKCYALAKELADAMDELGGVDRFRGGCYDAVERHPKNGYNLQFTWFNTKDFWQQEQGILAYLIQMRTAKTFEQQKKIRELAASMSAFYCAYFVDLDRGGIYFRTNDIGTPVMTGIYADKGGHAKSGYHIFELCYLAHLYTLLYNNPDAPITLYFSPEVPPGGKLSISVSPDFFADDSVDFQKSKAIITGKGLEKPIIEPLTNFSLKVILPKHMEGNHVNIQITLTIVNHLLPSPPAPSIPKRNPKKFAVIVESHFDETEIRSLEKRLPLEGYEMELVSYLWDQKFMEFQGNEHYDPIRVYTDIGTVMENLDDYACFFFVGGYCTDRLRYQPDPKKGQPNNSPVVQLVRKLAEKQKTTATICHSLWAFVCAPEVIKDKKVTCASNIIDDVINAGGLIQYKESGVGLVNTYTDGWLLTGQHPAVMDEFLDVIFAHLESNK